jgi:hypothetical protein
VPVPGGLKHIPTLADVNGDGGLDVIYRSLTGRLFIQNFGSTRPGPVSWATHRGNRQRDGNFSVSLFPPGTPLVTGKESGYRRASFSWGGAATNTARAWRIYRAEQPEGPFAHIITLTSGATSFTDAPLKDGCQYIYEVAAVYQTNEVHSAPFAVCAALNGNLVANGGFEENDNSHWDKWFTGGIDWTNMVATTNVACHGRKSMEVTFRNQTSGGSISQFGQYGTPDAYLPVTPGRLYSLGCFFKSSGLSQPSEHWLEWASTRTGEDTNPRPTRPYPIYFTPHLIPGTNATEWTYANRTFVMPAGFPNVELGHRYTVAAPASGSLCIDNVFFRSLPSPASTNWVPVIPFGAHWRYATGTVPTDWSAKNFNDASWPNGAAKFGVGGGPTNVVTPLPPSRPVYYFRHAFVAPAFPCEELLLSATCTDGGGKSLEIYFNGVKLVTTGIDATSLQGNSVQYYDLTPFLDLFQPGTNLIAVALNNVWQPSWDDVAFDLSLQAMVSPAFQQPRINSIARSTGLGLGILSVDLNISIPPNSLWRIESADSLTLPVWQLVDPVTTALPIPLSLRDIGQHGRLLPGQTPARFYRLVAD